jgi:hypothetical protein
MPIFSLGPFSEELQTAAYLEPYLGGICENKNTVNVRLGLRALHWSCSGANDQRLNHRKRR